MHKSTTDEVSSQPTAPATVPDCQNPDSSNAATPAEKNPIIAATPAEKNPITPDSAPNLAHMVQNPLVRPDALREAITLALIDHANGDKNYDEVLDRILAAVTKEQLRLCAADQETITELAKERAALAASFGKCQSELHALRTDNDTLAVENEKLRRILLRYLSPFDFAGGIATPINQLETLKVLLENEHLHPKA